MNRMEGKTIRWTFSDGPVANESYEHAFDAKGGLSYRKLDGDDAEDSGSGTQVKKYESADVTDDVSVFSYLAPDSGYTLTAVLDYGANTVVAFASNEKMLAIQHGTFEEVEADEKSGKKKPAAPRAQA